MLTFAVPGSLEQVTGGYLFGRRIVEGARARGRMVRVVELPGRHPDADATARHAAEASLASLPAGSIVVIDGLALPAYVDCIDWYAPHLRLVGFIHHPLSLETGLSLDEAAHYAALETRLWRRMHGFLCPSEATARAIGNAGIERSKIVVATPGTDKPMETPGRAPSASVRLLTVGTVSPRKGHDVLVRALAPLRALPWRLDCIGSLARDARFAGALRASIDHLHLADRIALHGELPHERLGAAYAAADVFVLPSLHEGYGMAYAEALAYGLPVIASSAGAIPKTVPAGAALWVEPGEVASLQAALQSIIGDAALRTRLAAEAARAGAALPDWTHALTRWLAGLDGLTA